MDTLLQDLRYALRTLRNSPAFTAVAVLTLALGIGANTAIFSVVNGVLLRALPYPEPDELMQVRAVFRSGGLGSVSYPDFRDLREHNRSFEALAAYGSWTASVAAAGEGLRVGITHVSGDFFGILGVQPILGRVFPPDDERVGASVVVVGHDYWQRHLGGNPDLADAVVREGEWVNTVIGVLPPGFHFPGETQLWVPRAPRNEGRTAHNWQVIGRLKVGVSFEQARSDLSAIARRLKQQYGDDMTMADAAVIPLHELLVGRVRPALLILLGAAGFLLLIACANVANLLLARAVSRQRELAVRLALGAGTGRLVRQFLTESLALSLAGGTLGVLLAIWGVDVLLAFEPGRMPRVEEIGVDWVVLAFALAVAVVAALAIGLLPGIRAAKRDVRESLAESQRTHAGGLWSQRVRSVLAALQIALTIVLLAGAGLLARSFLRLIAVDPGFRTRGAVLMDLWLPPPRNDAQKAALARFHETLIERLRAVPGIDRVGGVNDFPLGSSYPNGRFLILNRPDEVANFQDFGRLAREPGRAGEAEFRVASDGYFEAMGIPLLRGRLFETRDAPDAPHVALISQSLAERRWPGEDPIGKLIQFGNMDGDLRPFTIVGIVGDIRERSLATVPRPTFYGYYRQRAGVVYRFHTVMQGAVPPGSMTAAARRIVRELDPEVPLRFHTLEDVVSASLADRRFVLLLLGLFGATAMVVATMGVYGVIAYLASQRTQEMGIRMALGARAGDVVRLLVGQGAGLALTGIAIGLVGAFALTRFLGTLLYAVGANDPVSFAATSVVMLVAVLLASWIPARRAARVDPMVALRTE
jgi:putative ABC transport system permease protein